MIVLDEKDITVDGATCDLPGVSLQQWGRDGFCDYSPGSCFAKNLKWFQAYNEEAAKANRTPPYAVTHAQNGISQTVIAFKECTCFMPANKTSPGAYF